MHEKTPKQDIVDSFVRRLPATSCALSEKRHEHGLTSVEGCRKFVQECLTPGASEAQQYSTQVQPIRCLQDMARVWGDSTSVRWQDHKHRKQQLHLRVLLLLSFLHVLLVSGTDYENVDRHIEWITHRQCDRRNMVQSIRELHVAMNTLISAGWTERAVAEILVLCEHA